MISCITKEKSCGGMWDLNCVVLWCKRLNDIRQRQNIMLLCKHLSLLHFLKWVLNHPSYLVKKHILQKADAPVNSSAKSCSHARQGESTSGDQSCHFPNRPLFMQRPVLTVFGAASSCCMASHSRLLPCIGQ